MNVKQIAILALVALFLLPATIEAQEEELDEQLAAMAQASGEQYLQLRKQVVSLGAEALEARLETARWSESSWQQDLMVAIAVAHHDGELSSQLAELKGVHPEGYLQRRRPEPEAVRELRALGAGAAPLLMEIYRYTFDQYPFAAAGGYPEDITAAGIEELQQAERRALREGILISLGSTGHPAAPWFLAEVASDGSQALLYRRDAAVALGRTGDASKLPVLVTLGNPEAPLELRQAALRGAAGIRTAAALKMLLSARRDDALKQTAIVALGTFGSSWAFEAHQQDGDGLRRQAAGALVEELAAASGAELEEPIIQALCTIAHPAALEALEQLPGDEAVQDRARRAAERLQLALSRQR